jgi:hypothetical protein
MAWRQATILAGAVLAFVITEMAFFIAIGLLNQATPHGMLGWSQLAGGNIIGICGARVRLLAHASLGLPNEWRTANDRDGHVVGSLNSRRARLINAEGVPGSHRRRCVFLRTV